MKDIKVLAENGVTTISYQTEIHANRNQVWNTLKHPDKICEFHPLIKKSYMTSQLSPGRGAERRCHLIPMGVMQEKITDWDEGIGFTTEVVGGQMLPPYTFMKGRVELEDNSTHTLASFTFTYKLKFGFMGRIIDKVIIRPQFKNAPYEYITGLKKYVEGHP